MTMDLETRTERYRLTFVIGLVGAVACAVLGMVGPHDGAVWRIPPALRDNAATALLAAGHAGISVEARGQALSLRGIVEHERDIAAVHRIALASSGAGGPWAGGVTSVDATGVTIGAFDRPFVWSARREGGRVVLSGAAPSEAARQAIVAEAEPLFADGVVDEMRVAGGAPSPDFAIVARDAVRLLAQLKSGEARIVDGQIVMIGDGSQAGVEAVRAAFATPPAPFRARLALTIDGLDVEHPELQGLDLSGGDAQACERAFDRLMERNVINFASGSASIEVSSRAILDSLASVALRCDRFTIEVAGHTDNQGGRDLNMDLSRRRAEAVASYLASQGVANSRLSARGYGPDRPRVSNATPAGQAQNRRIEFYVGG